MSTVALITIGQAPRVDIWPDIEGLLTAHTVIEHGALDELSASDIAQLAPAPGEERVVSRLRDGGSATMSEHALAPLVQGAVDRAVAAGAQAILIMCTGNVPDVTAPVPLYTAEKLARAGMAGLADGHRLGLVVPEPEQQDVIHQRWADGYGIDAAIAAANPYAGSVVDLSAAAQLLADAGSHIIFLDCVGYTQAMADEVTRVTGVPAVTARSLAVRLLAAVV